MEPRKKFTWIVPIASGFVVLGLVFGLLGFASPNVGVPLVYAGFGLAIFGAVMIAVGMYLSQ